MLIFKIIIALVVGHFISAFLHYFTVLREKITRENLQIIVTIILLVLALV